MKIAIVFFSLEGNTRHAAGYLASITGGDLIELIPEKEYPRGRVSKFISGKAALSHDQPMLKPYNFNKDDYDYIIIGTPVWAGYPAPPINTFLATNDLSDKQLAFFACSMSGNGDKCLKYMIEQSCADPDSLALNIKEPLKNGMHIGDYRVEHWCLELLGNYETEELWDLYDKDRKLTGETMHRGATVPQGLYHIVISAWIKNSDGKYLMSKRSMNKGWCPGMWETTGGAVDAGETSLDAAVREINEELGIEVNPDKGKLVKTIVSEGLQEFYDVWMFESDASIDDIKMQPEEVDDVKWMSPDEIDELWNNGKLHVLLDYYKEII